MNVFTFVQAFFSLLALFYMLAVFQYVRRNPIMPIVSTEIIGAGRFSDGIHLRVKTIDNTGKERIFAQKVPHGTDINAFIATRVESRNKRLIRNELQKAVYDEPWDYVLDYASLTQLRDYVRVEYKDNKKKDLIPIARRIIEWIENGRFTATQFRNIFGMTTTQFTAFRTRLEALRDCDNLIESSEGE